MEALVIVAVSLFVFSWLTWAYVTRDGKCPMKPEETMAEFLLLTVSRMDGYHDE